MKTVIKINGIEIEVHGINVVLGKLIIVMNNSDDVNLLVENINNNITVYAANGERRCELCQYTGYNTIENITRKDDVATVKLRKEI